MEEAVGGAGREVGKREWERWRGEVERLGKGLGEKVFCLREERR